MQPQGPLPQKPMPKPTPSSQPPEPMMTLPKAESKLVQRVVGMERAAPDIPEAPPSSWRTAAEATSSAEPQTDTPTARARETAQPEIARAAFQLSRSGGGQAEVRLSPPELGTVRVRMSIRDGEITVRLVVQSDSAGQAVSSQLGQLRAALQSQGLRPLHMSVHVAGSGESAFAAAKSSDAARPDNNPTQWQEPDQGSGQHHGRGQQQGRRRQPWLQHQSWLQYLKSRRGYSLERI